MSTLCDAGGATSTVMLKALNCQYSEAYPRSIGIRAFAKSGGAQAIVVWAPRWIVLEPTQGQIDQSQWAAFDDGVRFAHEDKFPTYVAMPSDSPAWACQNGLRVHPPPSNRGSRLPPDDKSPCGPWAQYLRSVIRRHPNVQGIVVMNEPNVAFMDAGRQAIDAAKMLITARYIWDDMRATPLLMAPGTADFPGHLGFADRMLTEVRDVPFEWVHHHYASVVNNNPNDIGKVLDVLGKHGRKREVWLAEGGFSFATHVAGPESWRYAYNEPLATQEQNQLVNMIRHFKWCRNLDPKVGTVKIWANYTYRDYELGGGGFMSGLVGLGGKPHPIHDVWKTL